MAGTNIGSLLWVTGIDNTGLRKDANEASRLVGGIGNSANSAASQLRGMAGALGIVAGGAGLVSLARQVIEVRGQFQQLGTAFEVMLNSKEKADKLMSEAVVFAQKTPFTLTDVATNIKQLMAMGIETENVMATMKSLGDVAAGVSVPISRVAINYGQVAVLGKLQAREVRDFAMAGIPLTAELAKNLGKSKDQISEMVTAGQIGFPMVEAAFASMSAEGGKFYNLMEKQNASVTGQISNLTDKWQVMLNEIGKSNEGIIYGGISGLADLISNYETVLDILKVLVATYGAYRAALIVSTVSQTLQTTAGVYDIATKELQIGATIRATVAQSALNKAIMANPYVFALAAIVALGTALYVFSDEAKTTEEIVKSLNDSVSDIGKQIEIDEAISKYNELKIKVGKTKEEQDELNKLVSKLSALFPDAIGKTDQYGNAIELVTDKLIANNEVLKEALRLGAKVAKQEAEIALTKAQQELKRASIKQTTGKTTYMHNGYEETTKATADELSKNKDRIGELITEITKLQNDLGIADSQITKLGSKVADEFIKKHKNLFEAAANLTKKQAIINRQQLLELFGSANKNEQDAIIAQAQKLDLYAKGIKTTREETKQWTIDLEKAQAKLAELKNPDYESKTGTPGQEISDQEAIIKDLKEKLGIKKKISAEEEKLAKILKKDELGLSTGDLVDKRKKELKEANEYLMHLQMPDYVPGKKSTALNDITKQKKIVAEQVADLETILDMQSQESKIHMMMTMMEQKKYDALQILRQKDIDNLQKHEDNKLALMVDGFTKEKEIIDNEHQDSLNDIEKKKKEYLVKLNESEGITAMLASGNANPDYITKLPKDAQDAFDKLSVDAADLKNKKTNEITYRNELDKLDFLTEIEYRKNEITAGGFDRDEKLRKLNFETFKKDILERIRLKKLSADPKDQQDVKILEAELDIANIREAERKTQKLADNFYLAADAASQMASALGDSNSSLAELLIGVSKVANTVGDLVSKGAFSKEGMSDKDAIGSIISGATQLIGMVVGQAAKNKQEMKEYYDSIIAQQHQYNLSLNEQLRLNEEINGSVFYNDFEATLTNASKALKDANEQRNKAMEAFYGSEAIVGKKNVVSGGNVMTGIGAGAALGAGIGSIVPVIGTIIGAAVGAWVGAIVGLFATKKKDVVKPLLDVYPDLIMANGKFNIELAKTLIANKKVTEETKKILQDVIDWEEAAKKARDQITAIISDMAGNIGNDLRDALVDAFENGTNSAIKFGESVKDILENLVSQQIFNALFVPLLKKLEDDMKLSFGIDPVTGDATEGAEVDNNWIDDILRFYAEVPKVTEQFYATMSAVKVPGFDLFSGNSTANNTATNQITRALTEDTGSALMGLWRRSVDEQVKASNILSQSNGYLFAIAANTLRTADNTEELKKATTELIGINDNTKKSYLNDMGL